MAQPQLGIPDFLGDGVSEALQSLANAGLELDPAAAARLRALAGHSIVVRLEGTAEAFTIHIKGDRIRIDSVAAPAPSVILTADTTTLARMLLGGDPSAGSVEGDETVLLELNAVLRSLRPDLAGPLAPIIGAGPASAVADTLDLAVAALGSLSQTVIDAGDTLLRQRGGRHALDRAGFDAFLERAYKLRMTLDRLDARVTLLEETLGRTDGQADEPGP